MRCVVTPYLIPKSSPKTVNVGDGIILHAVERLLGRFPRELTFSARVLPPPAQLAVMEECSEVILAGANQLTDDYTVWPGFDRAALARTNLKLVPVGIGIHGEASRNTGMSDATRGIIGLLHDRLAYSSWRCPRTVKYLNRSMPALRGRFLMTGCPALFDRPLLSEQRFWQGQDVVAVTPTERGDFWKREAAVIDFVARRFRSSRRLLVIHQDYKAAGLRQTTRSKLASMLVSDKRSALRRLAQSHGFEVVVPACADAALALYETVNLHIGSRLHAHLHLLSQNRRSFLTKVDERITGFAEHFGFPICDPLRLDDYMDFDFEPVRERARRTFEVMSRFVDSL
jgi:hypothetical protein